ncbi:hypothetical protein O181_105138 [Austropuccinia psidii MF-1]|uniref:Uncharacterized protein n=1 Tax=Austropuccinia psidii MF-1 TaxID=1389203 RepID=A0A9Q3JNG4_9BASI|nr:hypothetical protein [Austropuccinia psidii MF-1]
MGSSTRTHSSTRLYSYAPLTSNEATFQPFNTAVARTRCRDINDAVGAYILAQSTPGCCLSPHATSWALNFSMPPLALLCKSKTHQCPTVFMPGTFTTTSHTSLAAIWFSSTSQDFLHSLRCGPLNTSPKWNGIFTSLTRGREPIVQFSS